MVFLRMLRWRGRPRQVVLQLTDRCNARCPQCGMNVTRGGDRGDLAGDTAKRIIDHCASLGVAALSLTGGEPFLTGSLIYALLDYARRAGIPSVRTGTNGYLFARPDAPGFTDRVTRLAEALARTQVRNFWISLDSADAATHEAGRGLPGMVEGVARALPILAEYGIHPTANLALNRFMGGAEPLGGDPTSFAAGAEAGLSRFFAFAVDLGFTMANCCYPMSDADRTSTKQAAYAATAADARVTFSRQEKHALFQTLLRVVPRHRSAIRIFTPLCAAYALWRQYAEPDSRARPCLGGKSFFFVDRKGDAYPCGYRGSENLGPLWRLDPARLYDDQTCRACDWECFRDPSELFAPLGDVLAGPAGWWRLATGDPVKRRLWLADLRYFTACDYFDGRKPLNPTKLARFRPKQTESDASGLTRP
jgi:MoaA/NifB/PqqE/SkfB family radical SAM enzyme